MFRTQFYLHASSGLLFLWEVRISGSANPNVVLAWELIFRNVAFVHKCGFFSAFVLLQTLERLESSVMNSSDVKNGQF